MGSSDSDESISSEDRGRFKSVISKRKSASRSSSRSRSPAREKSSGDNNSDDEIEDRNRKRDWDFGNDKERKRKKHSSSDDDSDDANRDRRKRKYRGDNTSDRDSRNRKLVDYSDEEDKNRKEDKTERDKYYNSNSDDDNRNTKYKKKQIQEYNRDISHYKANREESDRYRDDDRDRTRDKDRDRNKGDREESDRHRDDERDRGRDQDYYRDRRQREGNDRYRDGDQERHRDRRDKDETDRYRDDDRDRDRDRDRGRRDKEETDRYRDDNRNRDRGDKEETDRYRDDNRNRDRGDKEESDRYRDDDRDRDRDRSRRDYAKVRERYADGKEDDGHSRERMRETETRTNEADEPQNRMDVSKDKEVAKPKKSIVDILTKAGGAYIPPGRLKLMQESITDKTSVAYQRIAWEALKKSINGLVNKVNVANIANIVQELFQENLVRARGLFAQSLMRAQVASPMFSNVYSALVSIINTKFPNIGELILRRVILQFRRAFKRNDKTVCMNSARFIAHLVNQQVAHELLSLEILTLLLHSPTDDSVEISIAFLKEVGQKLTEVSPRGLNAVFERLRNILHEGQVDKRIQYTIEVMFAIRKDGFKDHTAVLEGLDLVEEEDQITHLLRLEENGAAEELLNVFKHDPEYLENEEKYKQIKREILGEGDSDESSGEGETDDEDEDENAAEGEQSTVDIIDMTETNMVALRRTIYLTIQSSLDFEECAHKMMKMQLKPGQEHEFCIMIVDCCSQQRSYEKFFGLLAQRFCLIKKEFMLEYIKIFQEQYEIIHRLDTNKLRNVSKFFAHLLFSDGIPWTVLECIKLNEEETTSSSRVFIKILFQELAEYVGLQKLNKRLQDPVLAPFFEGILPRDNPRNTRFAINFFTAIGLGGLTDELREHLKNAPKLLLSQKKASESSDSDSSSDSSDDSSSNTEDSSDSSWSGSDSDDGKRKKSKSKKSRNRQSPTATKKRNKQSTSKTKSSR